MTTRMLQTRHLLRLLAVILFSVLLTACGTDDEDPDPTATSAPPDAQPTVEAETESPVALAGSPVATAVPANTDMSAVDGDATPNEATPAASTAAAGPVVAATPAGGSTASGTPGVPEVALPSESEAESGTGSPAAATGDEVIPADTDVGDGTTGAIVPGTPAAATPKAEVATPVADAASPVADASPAALLTVTGCEVSPVPPFTGEVTSFILTEDLNFRTGPGSGCDLALPEPIGAFQVVEVIGGPVVREDDGAEWVQIRTLDTDGWVAFEFLEPVED